MLSADVTRRFFAEVDELSRQEGWTSDEHFTADGTLLESWASLKSFVHKDGAQAKKVQAAKQEDPVNPTINFRGQRRRNATHQSTTDPESALYRKAHGKEAKLCFGGHILMDNRHGLCADFTIHDPIAEPEPAVALRPLQAHPERHAGVRVKTVGGGQGVSPKGFCEGCREREIAPHVACKAGVKVPGLDGRTTTRAGYRLSQKIRKRVEEIWVDQDGGWVATESVSRQGADANVGLLCGGRLQFIAGGAVEPGGGAVNRRQWALGGCRGRKTLAAARKTSRCGGAGEPQSALANPCRDQKCILRTHPLGKTPLFQQPANHQPHRWRWSAAELPSRAAYC